jgi:hypothetical protein
MQDRMQLGPVLLGVGLFHLALVLLHLHLGIPGDGDLKVYDNEGSSLRHGNYPRSDPPCAVVLFAVDGLLGGGETRTAHAFAMIPFNLITVAAMWSVCTETAGWFAAMFGLLPGDLFFWEYRFELVPAALIAVGLALA